MVDGKDTEDKLKAEIKEELRREELKRELSKNNESKKLKFIEVLQRPAFLFLLSISLVILFSAWGCVYCNLCFCFKRNLC